MRQRPTRKDPSVAAIYWFARFAESIEHGDAIMAGTARDQLRELGFDVQPIRARRRRS
jgi:hypothetical protein